MIRLLFIFGCVVTARSAPQVANPIQETNLGRSLSESNNLQEVSQGTNFVRQRVISPDTNLLGQRDFLQEGNQFGQDTVSIRNNLRGQEIFPLAGNLQRLQGGGSISQQDPSLLSVTEQLGLSQSGILSGQNALLQDGSLSGQGAFSQTRNVQGQGAPQLAASIFGQGVSQSGLLGLSSGFQEGTSDGQDSILSQGVSQTDRLEPFSVSQRGTSDGQDSILGQGFSQTDYLGPFSVFQGGTLQEQGSVFGQGVPQADHLGPFLVSQGGTPQGQGSFFGQGVSQTGVVGLRANSQGGALSGQNLLSHGPLGVINRRGQLLLVVDKVSGQQELRNGVQGGQNLILQQRGLGGQSEFSQRENIGQRIFSQAGNTVQEGLLSRGNLAGRNVISVGEIQRGQGILSDGPQIAILRGNGLSVGGFTGGQSSFPQNDNPLGQGSMLLGGQQNILLGDVLGDSFQRNNVDTQEVFREGNVRGQERLFTGGTLGAQLGLLRKQNSPVTQGSNFIEGFYLGESLGNQLGTFQDVSFRDQGSVLLSNRNLRGQSSLSLGNIGIPDGNLEQIYSLPQGGILGIKQPLSTTENLIEQIGLSQNDNTGGQEGINILGGFGEQQNFQGDNLRQQLLSHAHNIEPQNVLSQGFNAGGLRRNRYELPTSSASSSGGNRNLEVSPQNELNLLRLLATGTDTANEFARNSMVYLIPAGGKVGIGSIDRTTAFPVEVTAREPSFNVGLTNTVELNNGGVTGSKSPIITESLGSFYGLDGVSLLSGIGQIDSSTGLSNFNIGLDAQNNLDILSDTLISTGINSNGDVSGLGIGGGVEYGVSSGQERTQGGSVSSQSIGAIGNVPGFVSYRRYGYPRATILEGILVAQRIGDNVDASLFRNMGGSYTRERSLYRPRLYHNRRGRYGYRSKKSVKQNTKQEKTE